MLDDKWRIVHWMGVSKPWGKRGHTIAPVRYNDQTIVELDARWRRACEDAVRLITPLGGGYLRDDCAKQPTRVLPNRLPIEFGYLALLFGIAQVAASWVWRGRLFRELLPAGFYRAVIILSIEAAFLYACVAVADEGRTPE